MEATINIWYKHGHICIQLGHISHACTYPIIHQCLLAYNHGWWLTSSHIKYHELKRWPSNMNIVRWTWATTMRPWANPDHLRQERDLSLIVKWYACTPDQLIASTQGSGQAPSAEVRSPPFLPRCAALAAAPEQVICAGVHPSHHRRRGTRPGRCSNTMEGVGGPLLGLGVNSVEEADIPHYLDSWLNKRYSLCIVPELVNECLHMGSGFLIRFIYHADEECWWQPYSKTP